MGFHSRLCTDPDYDELGGTLASFLEAARLTCAQESGRGVHVLLFYFAVHAGTVFGSPVIFCAGAPHEQKGLFLDEALFTPLTRIRISEGSRLVSIIVLDSCRDEIYDIRFKGGRLWTNAPSQTEFVLMFACNPGGRAREIEGRGVFSDALIRHISSADNIQTMFPKVVESVVSRTNGCQRPWISYTLASPFTLNPFDVDLSGPCPPLQGLTNSDTLRAEPKGLSDLLHRVHSWAEKIGDLRSWRRFKAIMHQIFKAMLNVRGGNIDVDRELSDLSAEWDCMASEAQSLSDAVATLQKVTGLEVPEDALSSSPVESSAVQVAPFGAGPMVPPRISVHDLPTAELGTIDVLHTVRGLEDEAAFSYKICIGEEDWGMVPAKAAKLGSVIRLSFKIPSLSWPVPSLPLHLDVVVSCREGDTTLAMIGVPRGFTYEASGLACEVVKIYHACLGSGLGAQRDFSNMLSTLMSNGEFSSEVQFRRQLISELAFLLHTQACLQCEVLCVCRRNGCSELIGIVETLLPELLLPCHRLLAEGALLFFIASFLELGGVCQLVHVNCSTLQALSSRRGKLRIRHAYVDASSEKDYPFFRLDLASLECLTITGSFVDLIQVLHQVAGMTCADDWHVSAVRILAENSDAVCSDSSVVLYNQALLSCTDALGRSRGLQHFAISTSIRLLDFELKKLAVSVSRSRTLQIIDFAFFCNTREEAAAFYKAVVRGPLHHGLVGRGSEHRSGAAVEADGGMPLWLVDVEMGQLRRGLPLDIAKRLRSIGKHWPNVQQRLTKLVIADQTGFVSSRKVCEHIQCYIACLSDVTRDAGEDGEDELSELGDEIYKILYSSSTLEEVQEALYQCFG